ncbi:MAG: hypothetical protein K2Y01_01245 [Rhabdochlamydiaceae bacterium]|nr:hypothetical protein [Rhabdochlamydiaceae bacterium]
MTLALSSFTRSLFLNAGKLSFPTLDGTVIQVVGKQYKLCLVHQNPIDWQKQLSQSIRYSKWHGTTSLRLAGQGENGFFEPRGKRVYFDDSRVSSSRNVAPQYALSRVESDCCPGTPLIGCSPTSSYNQKFLSDIEKIAGKESSKKLNDLLEKAHLLKNNSPEIEVIDFEIKQELAKVKAIIQKISKPLLIRISCSGPEKTNTITKEGHGASCGLGLYSYYDNDGSSREPVHIDEVYELQVMQDNLDK